MPAVDEHVTQNTTAAAASSGAPFSPPPISVLSSSAPTGETWCLGPPVAALRRALGPHRGAQQKVTIPDLPGSCASPAPQPALPALPRA